MKQIPASFRLLLVAAASLAMASAVRAADAKAPPPAGAPASVPAIDPTTGLPAAVPTEDWKDPDWKDPDKAIAELRYDGLPLGEVAKNLRDQFKNAFDVIVPAAWQNPMNPSAPMDLQSMPINIQLRNVTASEIFNAMNLVFETENSPVRWALKMNGNRPTAVLRVLPALVPNSLQAPAPPVKTQRVVIFVGDLLANEKPAGGGFGGPTGGGGFAGPNGSMTMQQLFKTVSEVYQMSYGDRSKGAIQFHEGAQVLVITGTPDEILFVQQTLTALRDKLQLERRFRERAAETKPKMEESKSP